MQWIISEGTCLSNSEREVSMSKEKDDQGGRLGIGWWRTSSKIERDIECRISEVYERNLKFLKKKEQWRREWAGVSENDFKWIKSFKESNSLWNCRGHRIVCWL